MGARIVPHERAISVHDGVRIYSLQMPWCLVCTLRRRVCAVDGKGRVGIAGTCVFYARLLEVDRRMGRSLESAVINGVSCAAVS